MKINNLWIKGVEVLIPFSEVKKWKKADLPALNLGDALASASGDTSHKSDVLYVIKNKEYLKGYSDPSKFFYLQTSLVENYEEVVCDDDIEVFSNKIDYAGFLKCRTMIMYSIFKTPIFL